MTRNVFLRHRVIAVFSLMTVMFAIEPAAAQVPADAEARATVDWRAGSIKLLLSAALPQDGPNLASARTRTERLLFDTLNSLIPESIGSLVVDSRRTVSDILRSRPMAFERLHRLTSTAIPIASRSSPDFRRVLVETSLLFRPEFTEIFIEHRVENALQTVVANVPETPFTGIVLYAKGPLPLFGTNETAVLVPALFPRIHDQDGGLVLEAEMVPPENLARNGLAGYAGETDETAVLEIGGALPYRIASLGVFGTNRSDIVIPREDARRLLASNVTRNLLLSGKIVIICDLPEQR